MTTVSTEAWIGVAGLVLSLVMSVVGFVCTLLIAVAGFLIKRAIDGVDDKVSDQGKRQDRFCERLGGMERAFAASAQAQITLADEVRRIRDLRHAENNVRQIEQARHDLEHIATRPVTG